MNTGTVFGGEHCASCWIALTVAVSFSFLVLWTCMAKTLLHSHLSMCDYSFYNFYFNMWLRKTEIVSRARQSTVAYHSILSICDCSF